MSKSAFKTLVKKKAYEFALHSLLRKKEKHSKLENLVYTKLETQSYLVKKEITKQQADIIFSYRTRMANYSENFRSYSGHLPCSLCLSHIDSQAMSLKCSVIIKNVKINIKYNDIFSSNISTQVAETLENIEKYRSEYLQSRFFFQTG